MLLLRCCFLFLLVLFLLVVFECFHCAVNLLRDKAERWNVNILMHLNESSIYSNICCNHTTCSVCVHTASTIIWWWPLNEASTFRSCVLLDIRCWHKRILVRRLCQQGPHTLCHPSSTTVTAYKERKCWPEFYCTIAPPLQMVREWYCSFQSSGNKVSREGEDPSDSIILNFV